MQKIMTLLLLMLTWALPTLAQMQVEVVPMMGYPFMLSGRNKNHYGATAARLQVSYKDEEAPWQPYLAATVGYTELPLRNKQKMDNLSMPVLNVSFKVGLNGEIKKNEFTRSAWTVGGGIGVYMLRPDEATLRMGGSETFLSYTSLMDKAWFPQIELSLRWVRRPKPELGWYFGVQVLTDGIWLKDSKVRYTTVISGTEYALNFNDIVVLPSAGGVIGYRF